MFLNKKIIISFLLFIIYIILIVFAFINIDEYSKVNAPESFIPTVIIDPGHGGEDGGASANNTVEKNLNLIISKKLYKLLISSGFNVKMIRRSDKMINTEGKNLRERKVSDMKNRLKIYNSNTNNIVISIHQNKFPIEKYYGTQIFYSTNNKNSKTLAEAIKTSVKILVQPDNEREAKPADKSIYLLSEQIFHNPHSKRYLKYLNKRVDQLLRFNITPIIVFDGDKLQMKKIEEDERQKRRNEVTMESLKLIRKGKEKEAQTKRLGGIDINPQMAYEFIKLLKQKNVEYYVAPYEADIQLAYLDKINYVDCIITEDSDLLALGCKKVLYKLDLDTNIGLEIEIKNLKKCTKYDFSDFIFGRILL